jgi:hypothetical protein
MVAYGGVPDSTGVVVRGRLQVERHLLIGTFLSANEADYLPVAA